MSKEYYKKCIITVRAQIEREREQKKRDNARYAALVKSASTTSSKAYYRKCKVDCSARHDHAIDRLKCILENHKASLKRCK